MLDTFNLTDKRDMMHKASKWEGNTVVTNRKNVYAIVLSVDTFPQSYEEWEQMSKEMWSYIRG